MTVQEIFLIALALSADAFTVGLAVGIGHRNPRQIFRLSFHFGLFQGLMPTVGWVAGFAVHRYIAEFDHWIAFGLLAFVGGRMIRGAFSGGDQAPETARDPTSGWSLVFLSIATSIDALAVGLSLGVIGSTILMPVLIIGIVAAMFTIAGMFLGRQIGLRWGKRVEVLGGIILIGIGCRILLDHLMT